MDDTVDPNCPGRGGTTDAGTLARLPWHSTGTTGNIFTTTEALPLCSAHCQLFRASRSHWQDVVCDDLVRTPSSTSAAAAAAAAVAVARAV